jgi:hypothetical protein
MIEKKPKTGRLVFAFGLLCVFIVLLGANGHAATVDDYRRRLETVDRALKELIAANDGSAASTELARSIPASIKGNIPQKENIELPGATIVTDNGWLWDGLKAFEAENDRYEREKILEGLEARLGSLLINVSQLTSEAKPNTKDDYKQKLAEILQRKEYSLPEQNEESLFRRWSREIIEWLARMFPRVNLPDQAPAGISSLSTILQVLLYVLLATGLGYLIYRFYPLLARRFGSKSSDGPGDRVILGELIDSDVSSRDIFADAERLALNGNLRPAIRKAYIALLSELHDRRLIALARHKTNRDYVRDLTARRDLRINITEITGEFERHWYGSAPTMESDWERFRRLYTNAIANI